VLAVIQLHFLSTDLSLIFLKSVDIENSHVINLNASKKWKAYPYLSIKENKGSERAKDLKFKLQLTLYLWLFSSSENNK
jgi:hypothetical protein